MGGGGSGEDAQVTLVNLVRLSLMSSSPKYKNNKIQIDKQLSSNK